VSSETSFDKPTIVLAAAATGTAAVLVFALLPVIAGTMADHYQLDDVQTGLVASAYFSVYALIALTSSSWIRKLDWNLVKRIGYSGMLAGLLLCVFADSFELACLGLAIVGAGAGLLFPISLTLVSDMEKVDRTYAIKISAEQLVPAGLLFLLSSALFAGYSQVLLLLALMSVVILCMVLSYALPGAGNAAKHSEQKRSGDLFLSILSLTALAISFAGFAGLWAFFERMAVASALDPAFTATWLAVGLITSGVGPLCAAVLGDKLGRSLPLAGAAVISILCLLVLLGDITATRYAATLTLLPLAYYFGITYMFSVIAEADHNGKMAGQMSFALAVGAGSGPALFGMVKADGGPVVLAMGALMATGAGLMLWIHSQMEQSND
jgi:predicted MFS family arabinose efflux permease